VGISLTGGDCHLYLILPQKPQSGYPITERGTKDTTFPVQVQKFTAKTDLAILTCH